MTPISRLHKAHEHLSSWSQAGEKLGGPRRHDHPRLSLDAGGLRDPALSAVRLRAVSMSDVDQAAHTAFPRMHRGNQDELR